MAGRSVGSSRTRASSWPSTVNQMQRAGTSLVWTFLGSRPDDVDWSAMSDTTLATDE